MYFSVVVARTISEVSAWTSGLAATAASDLAVATAYVFGAGEGYVLVIECEQLFESRERFDSRFAVFGVELGGYLLADRFEFGLVLLGCDFGISGLGFRSGSSSVAAVAAAALFRAVVGIAVAARDGTRCETEKRQTK